MPRAAKNVIVPAESNAQAVFPTGGLNVACEFGRQPAQTTPDALNVRTFEPELNRARGGSRPGLVRWIDAQVEGNHLIQHLNTIGITGIVNLIAGTDPADVFDGVYLLDPSDGDRNPGWAVPVGGWGVQPNRNVPNAPSDDDTANLIPGTVTVTGTMYTVSTVPTGSKQVIGLPAVPMVEGQAIIVVKVNGKYYGGPGY